MMKRSIKNKLEGILKSAVPYVVSLFLTLAFLVSAMRLGRQKIRIPFEYRWDSVFGGATVKGMIENGWYLSNPSLGAPIGHAMYDFPNSDILNFLIMKIITLFTGDWVLAINSFFILTFVLTSITSLFVFKKMKFSTPVAIFGSVLYSFIPYHLIRGVGHLFLSAYFMLPLVILVIIWLMEEVPLFYKRDLRSKLVFSILEKRGFASLIISVLISCSGVYYAFFTIFFLFLTFLIMLFKKRKTNNIFVPIALSAVIIIGVVSNLAPSLYYQKIHGRNPEVAVRQSFESEYYGLKVAQLILPVDIHRIGKLSALKAKYSRGAPLVTENRDAALGLLASIGFVILILVLFTKTSGLLRHLSLLNIAAILLATIGGFGAVFALILPQIRCYNRISIMIAFFGLSALMIYLDKGFSYFSGKGYKTLGYIALGGLLFIGVYDQTTSEHTPDYRMIKAEFENDKDFVGKIEQSVTANSMIFQLPYIPFPENPPVFRLGDYELFRGYLHSKTLRWSYGAIKGREGDLWIRKVSALKVSDMIKEISAAKFAGIYVDRDGYTDFGSKVEKEIFNVLEVKPIVSKNNRLVFYNMSEYNNKIQKRNN